MNPRPFARAAPTAALSLFVSLAPLAQAVAQSRDPALPLPPDILARRKLPIATNAATAPFSIFSFNHRPSGATT